RTRHVLVLPVAVQLIESARSAESRPTMTRFRRRARSTAFSLDTNVPFRTRTITSRLGATKKASGLRNRSCAASVVASATQSTSATHQESGLFIWKALNGHQVRGRSDAARR